MPELKQVKAWLDQATADLRAAQAKDDAIAECHRRYWFQQSCEKAIKALGLLRWADTNDPALTTELTAVFLKQHAPYDTLQSSAPKSKAIKALQREIDSFLRQLDNFALLKKLDATRPYFNPSEVSYRYPFIQDGSYVAPCDFEGWDGYQGNTMGVESAVGKLLKAVRAEYATVRRGPP